MKHLSSVAERITPERLSSYLAACADDLDEAMLLYDWNSRVSGALHEDIGRFEVVFRNALDRALREYGQAQGWTTEWYDRTELFPGKKGRTTSNQINKAKRQAVHLLDNGRGRDADGNILPGKIVAELTFGFWRYLCARRYLTSMWVPALAAAFEHHPETDNAARVLADVEDRVQRVHFLRNRVAHHEPLHQRHLQSDLDAISDVVGWLCTDTATWISQSSRTLAVAAARPT